MSWLVEALLASTLLMAVVLMLRRPVRHYFGARAAYALWALPLLRLALPPLPQDSAAAAIVPHAWGQGIDRGSEYFVHISPAVKASAPAFPWLDVAVTLWLFGVLLFVAIQTLGYAYFRSRMLADAAPVGREGAVRVVESADAAGPLAFGLLRRYVVLPIDFADRYTAEERELALCHELTHHRRGDLFANMAALAVLALHWCNPIAWFAYRAFRADQELACDAQVLARHGRDQAQAYGRAILKAAASGRHMAAACHLNTVANLKGRLKMLADHSRSLHRINLGMAAVAIVVATGLAFTASGSRAAQEMASVSDSVGAARFVRLPSLAPQPVDAAAAPVAPAAPRAAVAPAEPAPPAPPALPALPGDQAQLLPPPPAPPAPPLPPEIAIPHIAVPHVPTHVEIRRMVPRVIVDRRCDGGEAASTQETTGPDGRQIIRVRTCEAQIAREARSSAMAGIREARIEIAAERHLDAATRARILADLDRELARLRAGQD